MKRDKGMDFGGLRRLIEKSSGRDRVPNWFINATASRYRSAFGWARAGERNFEKYTLQLSPFGARSGFYGEIPQYDRELDLLDAVVAAAAFFDPNEVAAGQPARMLAAFGQHLTTLDWGKDIPQPQRVAPLALVARGDVLPLFITSTGALRQLNPAHEKWQHSSYIRLHRRGKQRRPRRLHPDRSGGEAYLHRRPFRGQGRQNAGPVSPDQRGPAAPRGEQFLREARAPDPRSCGDQGVLPGVSAGIGGQRRRGIIAAPKRLSDSRMEVSGPAGVHQTGRRQQQTAVLRRFGGDARLPVETGARPGEIQARLPAARRRTKGVHRQAGGLHRRTPPGCAKSPPISPTGSITSGTSGPFPQHGTATYDLGLVGKDLRGRTASWPAGTCMRALKYLDTGAYAREAARQAGCPMERIR